MDQCQVRERPPGARPVLAPAPAGVCINGSEEGITVLLVKSADPARPWLMQWKECPGYKEPLDKLGQWTEVNETAFSKGQVLLAGQKRKKNHNHKCVSGRGKQGLADGQFPPCRPGPVTMPPARLPRLGPQPHRRAAPRPGVTPHSRGHWRGEGTGAQWPRSCAPWEGQPPVSG